MTGLRLGRARPLAISIDTVRLPAGLAVTADAFARTLERELAALLEREPLPPELRRRSQVVLAPARVEVPVGAELDSVGSAVARHLHRELVEGRVS